MESNNDIKTYGSHEVKLVDRNILNMNGINKIISFDEEEFLMESVMGSIVLKGEGLELIKLDNHDGSIKIKGKINSIAYVVDNKLKDKESFIQKLFK